MPVRRDGEKQTDAPQRRRTVALATVFEAFTHDAGLTGRITEILSFLRERFGEISLLCFDGAQPSIADICVEREYFERGAIGHIQLFLRAAANILFGPQRIIVVNAFRLPLSAMLAVLARLRGRRVLCDMQDLIPEIVQHMEGIPPALRPAYERICLWSEWLAVRSASATLSGGRELNNIVASRTGVDARRFALWPNAHSFVPNRSKPPAPERIGEIRIAYMGGVQPGVRGIEQQLEAIALLARRGVNARFVTFTGPNRWFEGYVRSLGIEDRIEIHPYGPRDDALAIARSCHVAVMRIPLGIPSKFYEHAMIGNVILAQSACVEVAELLPPDAIFDGSSEGLAELLGRVYINFESTYTNQDDLCERITRFIGETREEAKAMLLRELSE